MKISAHFVPQVLFPHSTAPVDNFPAKKPPDFGAAFFSKVFAASMMPGTKTDDSIELGAPFRFLLHAFVFLAKDYGCKNDTGRRK